MWKANSFRAKVLFFILAGAAGAGCWQKDGARELALGNRLVEEKKYEAAVDQFERVIKRFRDYPSALQAARNASHVAVFNLKNYDRALNHYRFLVLHSGDENERFDAQLEIATIYFEHLTDYDQAIIEYSRLLQVARNDADRISFRKHIARSYFFLKNFYQAETELNQLTQMKLDEEDTYELLFLKGNIKMATKKVNEAIEIFDGLLEDYPERAKKDNVALHLAICYEEKENFARAIEVLDDLRPEYNEPDFIEDKIRRLQKRQMVQPGAKGLRK